MGSSFFIRGLKRPFTNAAVCLKTVPESSSCLPGTLGKRRFFARSRNSKLISSAPCAEIIKNTWIYIESTKNLLFLGVCGKV